MITEELLKEEKEITKIIAIMCANGTTGNLETGKTSLMSGSVKSRTARSFSLKSRIQQAGFDLRILQYEAPRSRNNFRFQRLPVYSRPYEP